MTLKTRPTFIGIGGHKCASTWLSECMREHPEVFMSEPKEIGYFSWHYDKGIDWYLKHFRGSENYKQKGEFTSHYLYEESVPQRILESVGKVKLIVVVRDPVKRALSQIKYGIRHGFIRSSIDSKINLESLRKMIAHYPEIVSRSYYSKGIESFANTFGEDNLIVLDQSDCRKMPIQILDKIWRYLDVKRTFIPSRAKKNISKGIVPRWQFLETLRKKIFYLANRNSPRIITIVRRLRIAELYRKINNGKEITLDNAAREYLEEIFKGDWEKTKSFVWKPKSRES